MLKKFIIRIIEYFKSRFRKKREFFCDELVEIRDMLRCAEKKIAAYENPESVMELIVALRYIGNICNSIRRMMHTTEPCLFIAEYESIRMLTDNIINLKNLRGDGIDDILRAKDMIYSMCTPVPDTEKKNLTYYSVTFGGRSKEYYYLSNGKGYAEGQYVAVPVGDAAEIKIAKVYGVYQFTPTNAPVPPESLKFIHGRAAEEKSCN